MTQLNKHTMQMVFTYFQTVGTDLKKLYQLLDCTYEQLIPQIEQYALGIAKKDILRKRIPIYRELLKKGMSYVALAAHFGVLPHTAASQVREYLPDLWRARREQFLRNRGNRDWEAIFEHVKKLRDAGYNKKYIAAVIGINRRVLDRRLSILFGEAYTENRRTRQEIRVHADKVRPAIIAELRNGTGTQVALAHKYSVSESFVSNLRNTMV